MQTILFIDDWMLDYRRNMVRRFRRPQLVEQEVFVDDGRMSSDSGYSNVIRDPESGLYRRWVKVPGTRPLPGGNFSDTLCCLESEDGFNWYAPKLGYAKKMGVDESLRGCVYFDLPPLGTGKVVRDPFDPDPDWRYKLVGQLGAEPPDRQPRFGVWVSPDGLAWSHVRDSSWFPDETSRMGSDCDNNLMYNPISGRYQVICRDSCLDRRVAMAESEDLINWAPPRVILYPDPLDETLVQFYSMTQHWYHEHFIGLMQLQHVSSTEMGTVKWMGKVDNELIYSYNGIHWNRTDRQPFIGRLEPGEPGGEQIYTNSMVEEDDGTLRFYSRADSAEHGDQRIGHMPEGIVHHEETLVHRLRAEGFACLEPVGGFGYFGTRNLIFKNGDLRLNFLAPNGRIWVQASHGQVTGPDTSGPYPGFSFDDSEPLSGDELDAPVRWKGGKNLAELVGAGVRLEFKLVQAQIYAVHADFNIHYGDPIISRI